MCHALMFKSVLVVAGFDTCNSIIAKPIARSTLAASKRVLSSTIPPITLIRNKQPTGLADGQSVYRLFKPL